MEKMEALSKALSRAIALIGFFGLFVLAVMTSLDVVLRWLFSQPIQGVNDVSAVVMAVVISACIPASLAFKQNISVTILGTICGERVNLLLEVFAGVLTLLFVALIAWQFFPYAAALRETGERTWVLAWPVWPWWMFAAFMLTLGVVTQSIVTLADLFRFFRRTGPYSATPAR